MASDIPTHNRFLVMAAPPSLGDRWWIAPANRRPILLRFELLDRGRRVAQLAQDLLGVLAEPRSGADTRGVASVEAHGLAHHHRAPRGGMRRHGQQAVGHRLGLVEHLVGL
jgi:hypothetical protein